MSLGINSFSDVRNESVISIHLKRIHTFSVSHSLLNNLDLGVSYIYNSETNINRKSGEKVIPWTQTTLVSELNTKL